MPQAEQRFPAAVPGSCCPTVDCSCLLPTAGPKSAMALVLPVQHPLLWLLTGWCKWVAVTIPVPASPSEAAWSCSKSLPKHLEQPVSLCRTEQIFHPSSLSSLSS